MSQLSVTQKLWDNVKTDLQKLFPGDTFSTWFEPLGCRFNEEEQLILCAPNEFSAIWLQDNYLDLIRDRVRHHTGTLYEVIVEVTSSQPNGTIEAQGRNGTVTQIRQSRVDPAAKRNRKLNLNPRNTFENFIVGPSNQLAHAASQAVAKSPGKAYNPLFLYGDTGLGKTHLMHAIAHYASEFNGDASVVYVSCEKFTNEFMRAIRDNTLDRFRKFYRTVDVLLIDDIQFLEGKERTQDEFFHTFNELFESQKQLCLSSDRPASEISRLESRLVSRFQWGMVTDIQAPDLETRTAILTKKANSLNYDLSPEILQFLAQRITRNVRRMEGALLKVATYASLVKEGLDLATVERLVHDILQEEAQNQITIEKVQRKVVEYYDLRLSDMVSKRRPNNIAFPRQVAMYLCRILTNHPLKEIGEAFGGRDHGTVIHACKTVENIMEQDESVKRSVEYLSKQMSHHTV